MVKEFVKLAKQLLNEGIFQQMEDSKQSTATFEELKTYLVSTHGNLMTNFQHLSRAWDLQRCEGEKFTDFAGRLEKTIREATVHIKARFKLDKRNAEMTADTAFSLMGAMLMSKRIKAWAPNIYPHLVKTMDRHYSAGGIASDAQRFLDRGIKTDMTTSVETTALIASQPANSGKPHSLESDRILADVKRQLLDLDEQLRQAHRHDPITINWNNQTGPSSNMKHSRTQRGTGQSGHPAVCRNYLRGRTCFKGNRCPYFPPPHAQVHIATTDTTLPGADSDPHNADAFFAFHTTSTIPVKEIADHMGIAAEQASDGTLSKSSEPSNRQIQDLTLPYLTPTIIALHFSTNSCINSTWNLGRLY